MNDYRVHDSFCRCRECKPPMTSRTEADYPPSVSAQFFRGLAIGLPSAAAMWALIYFAGRFIFGL